jgi:hypothetical protein
LYAYRDIPYIFYILYISNLLYRSFIFIVLNLNSYEPGLHEIQLLKKFERVSAQDSIEENALLYIAGYAAHRFRNRYGDLGIPTKDLPNPPNDWICTISRGNCMHPSEKLQNVTKIMHEEFVKFHGISFSREDKIFDKLTNIVCFKINYCIPKEVVACLVRTRTYIRLRKMNNEIVLNNILKKNSKKINKLSNKKNVFAQIK